MELTINGGSHPSAARNVTELLQELSLHVNQVAVELNGIVLFRQEFETTPLKDGDRVEIVRVVAGG